MSDTPRTDEAWMYDLDNIKTVGVDFAIQLERELNAANERIKRLEEAGDKMADLLDGGVFIKLAVQWHEAKEDKL